MSFTPTSSRTESPSSHIKKDYTGDAVFSRLYTDAKKRVKDKKKDPFDQNVVENQWHNMFQGERLFKNLARSDRDREAIIEKFKKEVYDKPKINPNSRRLAEKRLFDIIRSQKDDMTDDEEAPIPPPTFMLGGLGKLFKMEIEKLEEETPIVFLDLAEKIKEEEALKPKPKKELKFVIPEKVEMPDGAMDFEDPEVIHEPLPSKDAPPPMKSSIKYDPTSPTSSPTAKSPMLKKTEEQKLKEAKEEAKDALKSKKQKKKERAEEKKKEEEEKKKAEFNLPTTVSTSSVNYNLKKLVEQRVAQALASQSAEEESPQSPATPRTPNTPKSPIKTFQAQAKPSSPTIKPVKVQNESPPAAPPSKNGKVALAKGVNSNTAHSRKSNSYSNFFAQKKSVMSESSGAISQVSVPSFFKDYQIKHEDPLEFRMAMDMRVPPPNPTVTPKSHKKRRVGIATFNLLTKQSSGNYYKSLTPSYRQFGYKQGYNGTEMVKKGKPAVKYEADEIPGVCVASKELPPSPGAPKMAPPKKR